MPNLKEKSTSNKRAKRREFAFSTSDRKNLKKIGLLIQNELHLQGKSLEWLSFKIELSRSALQEIVAGRSNFRFLTFLSIADGLGYADFRDLLKKL
jgi:hypothetical protein